MRRAIRRMRAAAWRVWIWYLHQVLSRIRDRAPAHREAFLTRLEICDAEDRLAALDAGR